MPPLLVLALAPVPVLVIQRVEKVHMQCRHRRHKQPPNTSNVRALWQYFVLFFGRLFSFIFFFSPSVNATVFFSQYIPSSRNAIKQCSRKKNGLFF